MIQLILSPAKKLSQQPLQYDFTPSQPLFKAQTSHLIQVLQQKSRSDLKNMMKISDKLADLNFDRFQRFNAKTYASHNAQPALLHFQGDVYQTLDASSFNNDDMHFANKTLRILSGLYGVLRPFDLMQDYRLEMGTRLKVDAHHNLYTFWQDQLTTHFEQMLSSNPKNHLINLASQEYAKAIEFNTLTNPVIHIHFKEQKDSGLKTIGIMAKRARGLMARYIIKNQIKDPKRLQNFNLNGYQFQQNLSDEKNWVFTANRD